MSRVILCAGGHEAIVDDDDFEVLNSRKWHVCKGYALRIQHVNSVAMRLRMHRLVMNAQPGDIVDHINGNKLDNRKANLRFCTQRENLHNRAPYARSGSGFKGVYPQGNRWRAMIWDGSRIVYVGGFANPVEAARAYDGLAKRIQGEFAWLNFPEADRSDDEETAGPMARAVAGVGPAAPRKRPAA